VARMRIKAIVIALGTALVASQAGAVTIQQAYEAALKNDPTYKMSYYDKEAAQENRILGRSYLLPTLSGSYSASRNIVDLSNQTRLDLGNGVTVPYTQFTQPRYISRSSAVQLRQPILNLDGIARYRQGKVQAEQGLKAFESSTDEVTVMCCSRKTSWPCPRCRAICTRNRCM
jgi:protease secretion system outer membrane protein